MKKNLAAKLGENVKEYNKSEHNAGFIRLFFILVGILILVSALKGGSFWTLNNIKSIMLQFPEYGLLGLAFMLAFSGGSTDLSVVGMANLTSVLAAKIMVALITNTTSRSAEIVILIGICFLSVLLGVLYGLLNGLLINRIGMPAIIATLGTQQLFIGIAMSITKGVSISGISDVFSEAGNYSFFDLVPVPAVIYAVLAILVAWMLKATTYGQKLFMTGSNRIAAQFSGIDTARVITTAHVFSGILSSFSGLIMSARTNSANANFGSSYVMLAILVAVLGGADPSGGFGSVMGVTIAIVVLQSLASTLNMFYGVSNFYRELIWGSTLIIVIVINYFAKKKRGTLQE